MNFVKPTLARATLRPHFSKRIVARAVTLPAYLSRELTKRVFKINKSAQPGEEEEEGEGRALGARDTERMKWEFTVDPGGGIYSENWVS